MSPAEDGLAARALAACLTIPTLSHPDPGRVDHASFQRLHDELRRWFPRLHEVCGIERLAGDALLLRWPGRTDEPPPVLLAHLDVVPVGEESAWTRPPFSGAVADGHIWGRGALDCKGSLVAICAAVEGLIGEGFVPARDVWLSFGCDEEVAGVAAAAAVDRLRQSGVQPWFVLDEGGAIVQGVLPGVAAPIAVIGTAEKGVLAVRLTAHGAGGHAAAPAPGGAPARLARAITRLERHPFPARLSEPTIGMVERLADHARMPLGAVARRARRLRGVLAPILARRGGELAAMTRTTVAVTQLSGSPAANVLAATASAGLNVRVAVGETVDGTIERIRAVVRDPRVEVSLVQGHGPSPVSPVDDPAFELLADTVSAVFPGTVPVPYVMLAASDSRHFHAVWPRVYRFTPFRMTTEQRAGIHGIDERIAVTDLRDGVAWYRRLIESL